MGKRGRLKENILLLNTLLFTLLVAIAFASDDANITVINTLFTSNITIPSIGEFRINITNYGSSNITEINVTDEYNTSILNYTASQPQANATFSGGASWQIFAVLPPNESIYIFLNLTALIGNINATSNVSVLASDVDGNQTTGFSLINISIFGEQQQPPPGPQPANYTPLWSTARLAPNATNIANFNFAGAPYVARGPGCKSGMMTQQDSFLPGQGCNNDFTGNGSIAYDLGAVWVSQDQDYIAWNVIGPFIFENNLSACGGPASDAAYVVEFDADNNRNTGCNNSAGEGCYPGADYQIWYLPDTNQSLFALYNGTAPTADGRPANSGNCSLNPGSVCYINTSVSVAINVTCGASFSGVQSSQLGLVMVVNKSALPANLQLNFETNSFNLTQAMGPVDQLTDNGQDKFIFMGPGVDAGACFMYDNTNASACVNNTNGFSCIYKQVDAVKGFCEPDFQNFAKGTACFSYTDNVNCTNNNLGYCEWKNDTFAKQKSANGQGLCVEQFKPSQFSGGGDCDSDCFSCYTRALCNNSNANGGSTYGGCSWYNDTFNPGGWCDEKGMKFGCAQNPSDCFSQADCEAATWNWNSTWGVCRKDATTEICFNNVDDNGNSLKDCEDSYCKLNSKFCGSDIDTLTGDYRGMDPEDAQMQKLMGFNPTITNLKIDSISDSLLPSEKSTELVGFSIVVTPLALGMGVGISNTSELKVCGGAITDRKYMYFIDKDANVSSGCNITLDGTTYPGFEYLVKYGNYSNINSTKNTTRQLFACYNNNFMLKDAAVIAANSMQPIDFAQPWLGSVKTPLECESQGPGGPGGPGAPGGKPETPAAIIVEKADIGNPQENMRFLVASINGSWSNFSSLLSYDKIEDSYYTPGTIGFTPVNCFEEPTKCGSEFAILGGGKYMPFEDCMMPGDEDMDGLADCADPDCSFAPNCAGNPDLFNVSNDKTSPMVKMNKVDTFNQNAFVTWHTNEPTNGTIQFYHNDSNCRILNLTLWDQGLINNPVDDFKPWHNLPLDNVVLGYQLQSNTTYYYKLASTDSAGNPSLSSCLNFTTYHQEKNLSMKFDFNPGSGNQDFLGNMTIKINNQPMSLGSYADQANLKDVNITFYNPTAEAANNWSFELIGADLFQDLDLNFSDAFLANETSEKGNDMIGMDNSKWLDIAQNLGVDYVILKIPVTGDSLYHCQNNGTGCVDVTNTEGVNKTESGADYSKWKIPVTLGFSTYTLGGVTYNLTFVNITSPSVIQNVSVNQTITMNITNWENTTRLYNFTIEKPANTSAWLNNSISVLDVNLTENQSWVANLTVTATVNGTYRFSIIATLSSDSSVILNSSDDVNLTLNATPVVDTVKPYLSVQYPANASTYTTATLSLNFTVSDAYLDKCWFTNSTGSNISIAGCANTTFNALEGYQNITVFANDTSNNLNSSTKFFTVDTISPYLTVQSPVNATKYTSSNISVNYTVVGSDIDDCWYVNRTGGRITLASCANITFIAAEGSQNITVGVNDTRNNINTSQVFFTVDTVLPYLSVQYPANASTYTSTTLSLNYTATDSALDKCWFTNSTGSNISIAGCTNTTFNALEGYQNITVYANDTSNNVNSSTKFFTIDTIPPYLNVSTPRNGSTFTSSNISLNYSVGGTGIDDCWYTNRTGSKIILASCANTTLLLAEGSQNITMSINDTNNNINSSQLFLTLDTTAPNQTNYTVTSSYNSVVIGTTTDESVNVTIKHGNESSVLNSTSETAFAATHSITVSGLSASTLYYFNLSYYDNYTHHSEYGPYNFTTTATPAATTTTTTTTSSSSSTISSSSAGTYVSSPSSIKQEIILMETKKNDKVSWEMDSFILAKISSTAQNDATQAKLTVNLLESKPEGTGDAGNAYKYIEIKVKDLNLSQTTIDFKVENSWLAQGGYDKKNVVLSRYTIKWTDLPTRYDMSDANYSYYKAITPGFSYFAIRSNETGLLIANVTVKPEKTEEIAIIEESETIMQETASQDASAFAADAEDASLDEESSKFFSGRNNLILAIVALCMLIAGLIFWAKRKKA